LRQLLDVSTAISFFLFHELPPKVRRLAVRECARVLKPSGRLVLLDSLQRGDQPDDAAFNIFTDAESEFRRSNDS
jgi:ubiquinone/menaquinone biosynthesis C-methylase UbiE